MTEADPNDVDIVLQFLERYGKVPLQAKEQFRAALQPSRIKKREELVSAGQTCRQIWFAISGVYRVYKLVDGKEFTSYFCYAERNPVVAAFASLLLQRPSDETLECIEEGQLVSMSYANWEELCSLFPEISTIRWKLAEFNYLLALERISSLQHADSSYRYQCFLKQYPGLLNRIPHHYIASYLGITPESLSRIRRK